MEQRPICPTCNTRPVAINYLKEGVTHYRKQCDSCLRKGKKLKPKPPAWAKAGYTKKSVCEKCNFKAKLSQQMFVFHIDGNLANVDWMNLKTVCNNCRTELLNSKTSWKQSPLTPDF
jgi:hypothetical protein